jgi:hypothetical protein
VGFIIPFPFVQCFIITQFIFHYWVCCASEVFIYAFSNVRLAFFKNFKNLSKTRRGGAGGEEGVTR